MIKKPQEFVELRSEEVQEILGTPPGWLVRWGTSIVLLGFFVMLSVAWFVRYPDVVDAQVEITTSTPPADVIARSDGRVAVLLVEDTDDVQANQLLGVLQNTAHYQDVILLDSLVSKWRNYSVDNFRSLNLPDSLILGELELDYSNFVRFLNDFQFGRASGNASFQSNASAIRQQISRLEQLMVYDQKALDRVKKQLVSAEDLLEKQKQLFDQGITSRVDFEKEKNNVAELERQRDSYSGNILERQREIISLRNAIEKDSYGQKESNSSATTLLINSLNLLNTSINKWKESYLLTAPIVGKISLNGLTEQQFVQRGEQIMTVVPVQSDLIVGRAKLPVAGSGKVQPNQKAIIKLDNYPYREFGIINGQVVSKSLVPKDNVYTILIALPITKKKTLRTSMGKELPFAQQLQGKAEIVTEDKGFLQRIGEQMYGVIQ
ncbi:MAG: HlyD family efflux transporter periplasmic adaptor subunit [Saprospiraceae bacterium]